MRSCSLFATLLLTCGPPAHADTRLRPTFSSEVLPPDEKVIRPLLEAVCREGVRMGRADGWDTIGCGDGMYEILSTRNGARRYPWSGHVVWPVHGVIFGHFLSPSSQDVAISCRGCESHASGWGGTLLLTKQFGRWAPLWYKPGVITQHCRRITLASGRQILFCEQADSRMGQRFHDLYTVDFTNPRLPEGGNILRAHSFNSHFRAGVEQQTQSIEQVSFYQTKPGDLLVRVHARHGHSKLASYVIDFRLTQETLQVTPQTAVAARLFAAGPP